ncbi:beta-lactamase-like protein [Aspergillus navahoensis]
MVPSVPGLEGHTRTPALSFLLEHSSGRRLVFDLGIRRDYQNYAPKIAEYIPTMGYKIEVEKNVAEILGDHGVAAEDVDGVIWSHWHWDHIGDPSTFPSSTDLIAGPGFKEAMLPGYPANPDSPIPESDYAGRTLREITFNPGRGRIGRFPAADYFGDGSFYLLDSPGHAMSPPRRMNVSGLTVVQLQSGRGRKTTDSLFDPTFGYDIPLAMETIRKLQEVDCDEDKFVIIAHDSAVRDGVPHFPAALNE